MSPQHWIAVALGAAVAAVGVAVAAESSVSQDATSRSGTVRRVVVEAEVHGAGRTPVEGRREALQRAREQAVAEVAGIQVSAQQLRLKAEQRANDGTRSPVLDGYASLVRTSTWGRIVREEVVHRTELVDAIPVYHVQLDADVLVEERAPDPGFSLELRARPDTHTFRDGESVTLELMTSVDCYVTLLNVLSDGTVTVLFPAKPGDDNRIVAGGRTRFPASAHGLDLRVHLLGGRDRDYEQLLVIGTLDPLALTFTSGDLEASLAALNRWLLSIPVDRRTEALWDYEVVR